MELDGTIVSSLFRLRTVQEIAVVTGTARHKRRSGAKRGNGRHTETSRTVSRTVPTTGVDSTRTQDTRGEALSTKGEHVPYNW